MDFQKIAEIKMYLDNLDISYDLTLSENSCKINLLKDKEDPKHAIGFKMEE